MKNPDNNNSSWFLRCTVSGLALLISNATNAAPPDAGSLGNQLKRQAQAAPLPPPATLSLTLPGEAPRIRGAQDSGQTLVIRQVNFSGDRAGISEQQLQALLAEDLKRPLTFSGLQGLAARVTDFYRASGLLVARAVLPPQTILDGVLTLQIIPGRYDAPHFENTSRLRDSMLRGTVKRALPQGEPARQAELTRLALMLGEIPGARAEISLRPGARPGATAADIRLTPDATAGGYAGLDNQGGPVTGRARVMEGGYLNGLAGLGGQLRLYLLKAWEHSDLFSGALDYSLLAGGPDRERAGTRISRLTYRYSLNGLGFKGHSTNWGLYLSHPRVRTARARVDARLDAGLQYLKDRYPAELAQAGGDQARKRVSLISLSVTGSLAPAPGGQPGTDAGGVLRPGPGPAVP